MKVVLDRLLKVAPKVEATAKRIQRNASKDKIFPGIIIALERKEFDLKDLQSLISDLGGATKRGNGGGMVRLDNGYWLAEEDIFMEEECRCERGSCVGWVGKVSCLFSAMLSDWVLRKGLFWRCYDEIVQCPRCGNMHKRGHIGASDVCGRPYLDLENQMD